MDSFIVLQMLQGRVHITETMIGLHLMTHEPSFPERLHLLSEHRQVLLLDAVHGDLGTGTRRRLRAG